MKKSLFVITLCFFYLHAQAESVTNFIADHDFYTAYADDLDQEVVQTRVLTKDWCQYLTNEDIEFGKRLAVLSRITHNSIEEYYDYETDQEGRYMGEQNFKVYNAYILNKYKLPKMDYSKVSVQDATIHNLLHQASSTYYYTGQEDLPLIKELTKKSPKSLTLSMLELAMDFYYFRGNVGFKKIFKQAQYIEDNYDAFTMDIRPLAVQNIIDEIKENDPCKGPLVYDDAPYCLCHTDEDDNLRSFEEQTKCLDDIQAKVKAEMDQTWNKGADLDDANYWEDHSIEHWKAMKESALAWMDSEMVYINKQKHSTAKGTKTRQIISTQDVLRTVRDMSILWGMGSGGESRYPLFIEERNPAFFQKHPNCQWKDGEDKSYTMEEYMLMHKEIDRILNETYKKLGGASNPELRKAQLAWLKVYTAQQKYWTKGSSIDDISSFDFRVLYLDKLISRIQVWESYLADDNQIGEQYMYKYTYSRIYNMLTQH